MKVNDAAIHSTAAAAMMTACIYGGAFGAAAAVSLCWWLRECAQDEPHDLLAAIRNMPGWSMSKHVEWIAPSAVALAFAVLTF